MDKSTIESNLKVIHAHQESEDETEEETLANAHIMKLQYAHIWNNLSRMETSSSSSSSSSFSLSFIEFIVFVRL